MWSQSQVLNMSGVPLSNDPRDPINQCHALSGGIPGSKNLALCNAGD